MAIPIWKDKFVDFGVHDSVDFCLRVNGTSTPIIYRGRAYSRPGETHVRVKVNDICADYLHNVLPTLSQAAFSALDFPLKFYVQQLVNGSWVSAQIVEFQNDWSYDDSYNVATMGMAFPVNGRIDARQWLTYTAYNASTITATITFTDGTTSHVYIPVAITNDFNADFNNDFARSVRAAGSGTAVFNLSEWDNVAKITIGSRTWEVVSDCEEWALYYVNAYGGWDSLLIEGNTKEQDTLTRHTMRTEYDNSSTQNRGTRNYVNELQKRYTMHTSWLSDDEAARMHHLLNSPEVYMYNIRTGEMFPVVLDNTQTEYKTFKGNGGRLVDYTIEATLAQERIRR